MDKLKVLLIDDDPSCQLVVRALSERSGWDITVRSSAMDGLETFKQAPEQFALVLMDWQMPVMDGLECTRRIRALEKETAVHTTIIGITAHAFTEHRQQCLAAGMDDYLSKPFTMDEFYNKVEQWVSAPLL
jgi:hypothetical protein